LICGSGIGIGISANKCGMRCSTAFNEYTARECGKHFQLMALGERVVTFEIAKMMVD
jgi:ribose 5-phosphate isomerase RpiB